MRNFALASSASVVTLSVAVVMHVVAALHTSAPVFPPGMTPTQGLPPASSSASVPGAPDDSTGFGDQIVALLDDVDVVRLRPVRDGYDRSCSPGDACSFGTEWSDDTSAPDAHNGCDTRNDVLAHDLTGVVFEPESNDCDVVSGQLLDPYTGTVLDYASDPGAIHVDHIYPLAAAWDFGAADWSQARRNTFANDTEFELMAVLGTQNMSKGDSTPGHWMPPAEGDGCAYLVRYLTVAVAYQLPISAADARVADRTPC